MGFFSVNKEVLPIGISLRVPIGTRSDGKLNLVLYINLSRPVGRKSYNNNDLLLNV